MFTLLLATVSLLLTDLQNKYSAYEASPHPPAGYSVEIVYDKKSGDYTGELHAYGQRSGLLKMPPIKKCPFCFEGDFQLVRSQSDRVLFIPNSHIPHWFAASLQMQEELLQRGVEWSAKIEECVPLALTTNGCYLFELHVGSFAGQTIPHLHLRFQGGPKQGRLDQKTWEMLIPPTS